MRYSRTGLSLACAFAFSLALSPLAAAEKGEITLPAWESGVIFTLSLNQGEALDFSWSANASVEFSIKNLAETAEFLKRPGQVGSVTFEAPMDGAYVFEFENDNPFDVTVQWTMDRGSAGQLLLAVSIAAIAMVAIAVLVLWVLRKQRPPV